MRGAKNLHGKRVRLLRDYKTKGGDEFHAGQVGLFRKVGVVRCLFIADDGRRLDVSHERPEDFWVVG